MFILLFVFLQYPSILLEYDNTNSILSFRYIKQADLMLKTRKKSNHEKHKHYSIFNNNFNFVITFICGNNRKKRR